MRLGMTTARVALAASILTTSATGLLRIMTVAGRISSPYLKDSVEEVVTGRLTDILYSDVKNPAMKNVMPVIIIGIPTEMFTKEIFYEIPGDLLIEPIETTTTMSAFVHSLILSTQTNTTLQTNQTALLTDVPDLMKWVYNEMGSQAVTNDSLIRSLQDAFMSSIVQFNGHDIFSIEQLAISDFTQLVSYERDHVQHPTFALAVFEQFVTNAHNQHDVIRRIRSLNETAPDGSVIIVVPIKTVATRSSLLEVIKSLLTETDDINSSQAVSTDDDTTLSSSISSSLSSSSDYPVVLNFVKHSATNILPHWLLPQLTDIAKLSETVSQLSMADDVGRDDRLYNNTRIENPTIVNITTTFYPMSTSSDDNDNNPERDTSYEVSNIGGVLENSDLDNSVDEWMFAANIRKSKSHNQSLTNKKKTNSKTLTQKNSNNITITTGTDVSHDRMNSKGTNSVERDPPVYSTAISENEQYPINETTILLDAANVRRIRVEHVVNQSASVITNENDKDEEQFIVEKRNLRMLQETNIIPLMASAISVNGLNSESGIQSEARTEENKVAHTEVESYLKEILEEVAERFEAAEEAAKRLAQETGTTGDGTSGDNSSDTPSYTYIETERRLIITWVAIVLAGTFLTATYFTVNMPLQKDPLLYTKIYAGH